MYRIKYIVAICLLVLFFVNSCEKRASSQLNAACEVGNVSLSHTAKYISYEQRLSSGEAIFKIIDLASNKKVKQLHGDFKNFQWSLNDNYFYVEPKFSDAVIQGSVKGDVTSLLSKKKHFPFQVNKHQGIRFLDSEKNYFEKLFNTPIHANLGYIPTVSLNLSIGIQVNKRIGLNANHGVFEESNSNNKIYKLPNSLDVWVNSKGEPIAHVIRAKNELILKTVLNETNRKEETIFTGNADQHPINSNGFHDLATPFHVLLNTHDDAPNLLYSVSSANSNYKALYEHNHEHLAEFRQLYSGQKHNVLAPVVFNGELIGVNLEKNGNSFVPLTELGQEIERAIKHQTKNLDLYELSIITSSSSRNKIALFIRTFDVSKLVILNEKMDLISTSNFTCNYPTYNEYVHDNNIVSYHRPGNEIKPLVIYLHGGPHENERLLRSFHPVLDFFEKSEHEIVRLNYFGSTGFNKQYVETTVQNYQELLFKQLKKAITLYKGNPDRKILLIGESFGGYLSILFGNKFKNENMAFISINAPHTLKNLSTNFGEREFGKFSRIKLPDLSSKFEKMDAKGLLIQGDKDNIILKNDRMFQPLVLKPNVELVVLPNSDHSIAYADMNDLLVAIEKFMSEF